MSRNGSNSVIFGFENNSGRIIAPRNFKSYKNDLTRITLKEENENLKFSLN